jgi:hypothetical protein
VRAYVQDALAVGYVTKALSRAYVASTYVSCVVQGKSSPEILAALKERYARLPYEELPAAAREQMAITELRLGGLLGVSADAELQARTQRRADQASVAASARLSLSLSLSLSLTHVRTPGAAAACSGTRERAAALAHHDARA